MEQKTKMRGICKSFLERKGYGFVLGQDGREFFFHYSSIKMPGFKVLAEGQEVEFETVEPVNAQKGPAAINIIPFQDSIKGSF